jgi:hypothetical protein
VHFDLTRGKKKKGKDLALVQPFFILFGLAQESKLGIYKHLKGGRGQNLKVYIYLYFLNLLHYSIGLLSSQYLIDGASQCDLLLHSHSFGAPYQRPISHYPIITCTNELTSFVWERWGMVYNCSLLFVIFVYYSTTN